uniref:CUB domain-containing protein n=1 Tax=Panagrolaimus sp. ES5 TaxID=591445 RepID=A0AC34F4K1_9BILA
MFKLLILLLLFVNTVKAADVAVCSTTANNFNTFNVSDFFRFQSPNYPATMDIGNVSSNLSCNAMFMPKSSGDYLWFAFINGAFMEVLITDNVTFSSPLLGYESNYAVTTFTSTSGYINFQFSNQILQNQPWTAFDAIVLQFSPSVASECPFSGQTISLDNDTIIPISSDYGIYSNSSRNCSWTFKIDNPGYQFKIYIKQLTYDYKLIIKNDNTSNGFGFNVSLSDPQVLYLNGSELNIMLYNVNNNSYYLNGFFAIISAVPIKANYFEECRYTNTDTGYASISNLDYVNGYKAYSTCGFNIKIPSGFEAIIDVQQFWLEAGVDKLLIVKGSQIWELKNEGFYKLKTELDGSNFKFIADGNIRQAGFNATCNTIKCECAPSNYIIPCTGNSQLTPLPNSVATYCDNQDCTYTVSLNANCSMDYFTISPTADLRNTSWLAIYVNGNVFQNYTEYAIPEILPYPRTTNITIVFHSGKSASPFLIGNPIWLIETTAVPSPITNKIQLNSTNLQSYAVWLDSMSKDQAITVCSPDNDLELFISEGISTGIFDLYDSDGLTNFVGTLSSNSFPETSPGSLVRHIMSKSNCFTIYCSETPEYVLSTVLFRMQKLHTKNCNTAQNVVRLMRNLPAVYTVNATNEGPCEMIVFGEQYNLNTLFSFNEFQTSSNAIFSFSSALNGKPFFDMPSNETALWQQTAIYTSALSVMAPASSSLTFNVSAGYTYIKEGNDKRKGILVSPIYSGTNLSNFFIASTLYSFHLNNAVSANFVVKDLPQNANVTFQNYSTNETHTFTPNESYFTNTSAFYISSSQNTAFRIEYGFDVLVSDNTATSPSTPATVIRTTPKNNGCISSYHFMALLTSFIFAYLK